ncbi:glycosyltransferase [Pseudomonas sp. H3(2019)]|uniref:glycosyltransferase n=1 Tax=Pseudomonas sp. H3(2019) TaxID=2598724 RepID=UPI0011902F16|nr:glycosyltransferase [Pseudomonas sp. H3(2019)]TVT82778.1 glycosyltransferase family 4 protein [Pseudomonas sp. H3(2019)]
MSVKNYGIYLSYPPGVDLRHEGLGRYLAAFLKGTSGRDDVHFVLVCPSWSKKSLEELFLSEGVQKNRFEVVSPNKEPLILKLYEAYLRYKKRAKKPTIIDRVLGAFSWGYKKITDYLEARLIAAHSVSSLIPLLLIGVFGALLFLLCSPLLVPVILLVALSKMTFFVKRVTRPLSRRIFRLKAVLSAPKEDALILRLYKGMESVESKRMLELIDSLSHVLAWYSPTAFWPAFNDIKAPKLMCIPDVVLTDFPVGFSNVGGERFLRVFGEIEETIYAGQNYVTYSGAVKWDTLVDRYAINPSKVSVIHHAPNSLNKWVEVTGGVNPEEASHSLCLDLFRKALLKSVDSKHLATFSNPEAGFLFYASQIRPNKNVLSLLRAYEYLLRSKFIGHKLILTGNPNGMADVIKFIKDNFLENDVLCLHSLTVQELAACYKLADLAVNPSLSEGGCPFTFTEALSVGTPVAMARIAVAEEVLNDDEVQELTFFDPYDWKDMAKRIQLSLHNREEVLAVQTQFYKKLSLRSWTDVVNEHVDVLDSISSRD